MSISGDVLQRLVGLVPRILAFGSTHERLMTQRTLQGIFEEVFVAHARDGARHQLL